MQERPRTLDISIAIGSVAVARGDIVVGDSDGVMSVRKDISSEVLERTVALAAAELTKRGNNARADANGVDTPTI